MSTKNVTCKEALGLLFADPDSEGENLPSEDDGQLFASPGASGDASPPRIPASPAVGQSVSLHQTPTSDPFPSNVGGEENVSRGRSLHRGVSKHGSTGGNGAGSNVGVLSFYRACQVNAVLSDTVPSQSVRDRAASSLTNLDGHVRCGRSVSGRAGGSVAAQFMRVAAAMLERVLAHLVET